MQKAGTSWWFDLITEHPGVARPPFKELHFFDRMYGHEVTDEDLCAYGRHFPRHPTLKIGEWTPRYLYDAWTLPLLSRAAPKAQLLVLLRDPVERYRSGLCHDLAKGAPDSALLASDHMARGDYAVQLRRLFAHVPADRVLVLQYERCRLEPAEQLKRTYGFLGLDDSYVPDGLDRRVNVTQDEKPPLPAHTRRVLVERYRADVPVLAEIMPGFNPDLWESLR